MGIVKEYFVNTQFHGFHFVAESGRHWTERLFWLVCICASWYLCFQLMESSWRGYQNNAISLGTETDYSTWNTSLFSVSVCETRSRKGVAAKGKELWGPVHDLNLDAVLLDIAFFKGDHYFLKMFCTPGPNSLDCPKSNFRQLSSEIRSNCSSVFSRCSWMGVSFDCCEYFVPLQTERGLCFTINSMQTSAQKFLPLISNKLTAPGRVYLELLTPADVYIHGPEDVPFINAIPTEVIAGQIYTRNRRIYSILEIVNDLNVKDVDVEKRRCRFPDENYIPIYNYYSYSVCIVNCRIQQQLKQCNCTNHLIPRVDELKTCDISGLLCLMNHFESYSKLINSWSTRPGLACDCMPSCLEPEYQLVEANDFELDKEVGIVELSLATLPTLRLKRSVVRGQLDLVVSMGGSAGLFVGASLLSFIELVYYFTIRLYWSRRIRIKTETNLKC